MNASDFPNRVRLRDIASALGLSTATVSLAMRNDQRITETRRNQVKAAAERMGYSANPAATMLVQFKRTSSIKPIHSALAWINAWPDPKGLRAARDFNLYWQGAAWEARRSGYRLEEFLVNETMPAQRLQQILRARGIRGILIPPHPRRFLSGKSVDWKPFEWEGFSVVRFGQTIDLAVDSVGSNGISNAVIAFENIRERGYERIAFVGAQSGSQLFKAGFLCAQDKVAEDLRLPMFLSRMRLLPGRCDYPWLPGSRKRSPTRFFTSLPAFRECFRKESTVIPGDIGLGCTSMLEFREPFVDAGLDQNSLEIGRTAARLVLSQMHDNAGGVPAHPPLHFDPGALGRWGKPAGPEPIRREKAGLIHPPMRL